MEVDTLGHLLETCNDKAGLVRTPDCRGMGLLAVSFHQGRVVHPYNDLPARSLWRPAVSERNPLQIDELWTPRFDLKPSDGFATVGSCFAQHIGRALAARGFRWVEGEPAPPFMSPQARARFNYGVFSFRTGNIYTPALLKQWIDWAFGNSSPPPDVWSERGRYYDPFRPVIEPNGFASADEMLASRESALNGIRNAILASDYFVFTLGLTEGWINTSGHVYPMCPGTTAGAFDPARHHFINYDYHQTRMFTHEAFAIISHYKPGIRYILTVSPVPLTATATGGHVVVATTYSKSTLRAVAGDMYSARTDLDYFPSFEIISAHPFRGSFYDPNMRTVGSLGVEFVMNSFFRALRPYETQAIAPNPSNDVICEEELLDAFI